MLNNINKIIKDKIHVIEFYVNGTEARTVGYITEFNYDRVALVNEYGFWVIDMKDITGIRPYIGTHGDELKNWAINIGLIESDNKNENGN